MLLLACINDMAYARNGDGGFGNVGSDDDFAGEVWCGLEDTLLEIGRKGGVERKDEKGRKSPGP